MVSAVGFGGYRVATEEPEHAAAMFRALEAGCNLLDTSANYEDGGSERLVGQVLEGHGRRDQVVVVSKAGYLQGESLARAEARERAGHGYPQVVQYASGLWHCIHPDCLRDQLAQTLARVRLERLDVLLLHNPEYFFGDHVRRGSAAPIATLRAELDDRMRQAFECMEALVAEGRIGWYGVSSNTLAAPASDPRAMGVGRVVGLAREVGGPDHHMGVIQLPLNLLEPGALTERNTGPEGNWTPLEAARDAGLGVLINRPLNASQGQRLVRLADFPTEPGPVAIQPLHRACAALEREFVAGLARMLSASAGGGAPDTLFRFADEVVAASQQAEDVLMWEQYVGQVLSPNVSRRVGMVDRALDGPIKAAWQMWVERYGRSLTELVQALGVRCARRGDRRSRRLARTLDEHLGSAHAGGSLARKAVAAVMSQEGVTSVLVGMRRPYYVTDIMATLRIPRAAVGLEAFHAAAQEVSG